ncbi:MAG: gamma-glutamyltransferase, partial [Pirellulaceae bacterium]|nr:gamma-glutamyltransferase [Pirellulaceae bacterium]
MQIVEYRSRLVRTFLAILVAVALSGQIFGAERAQQPAERARGIVVTVSPPASDVGLAVLNQGGNAVDATVATALAL